MELKDYFEKTEGTGVLATADARGKVDLALYARPHVLEKDTVAFIMAEHLSHTNLQENPHAAYLFIEEGKGYCGKRLYLTKIKEEKNTELINTLRRRCKDPEGMKEKNSFLVYFRVDLIRPLVGDGAA